MYSSRYKSLIRKINLKYMDCLGIRLIKKKTPALNYTVRAIRILRRIPNLPPFKIKFV